MKSILRFVSYLLVLSCVILPFHLVNAQGDLPDSPLKDQTWVRLGGPPGGVGYDIRVHPENPDKMLVTDAMAGMHLSDDRGQTWYTSNEGIDLRSGSTGDLIPVFSARYDPNDPENIWLGLQDLGGIFFSEDGGKTWERRMNGIEEEYGISFRGFAVQPGNSDIVYAAAEVSSDWWAGEWISGGGYQLVKGAIYKTTDRGMSWRAVWRGDNLARYVLIDPNNPNTLYASTGIFDREAANSDWSSQDPGGIGMLKSTDAGESWTQINKGLGNLYVNSIDFHPLDSNVILAGTRHANPAYNQNSGIYLTRDGGENWEYMAGSDATAVEFADNHPNYGYAIGQNEFFRTTDGGNTWEQVNYPQAGSWGDPRIVSGFAMDLEVDPEDPLILYVNAYQGGNYISYDGGESWETASRGYAGSTILKATVFDNNPAYVLVTGRTGPFLSVNGGRDWIPVGAIGWYPEGSAVAIDPEQPNHLLSADLVSGCIMSSDDYGNSWSTRICHNEELTAAGEQGLDPSFTAQGPTEMVYAPSDPDTVYAGFGVANCQESLIYGCDVTPIKSMLVSTDAGLNWTTIGDSLLEVFSVSSVVIHPEKADTVWAASSGDGIFKSEDGGVTWSNIAVNLRGKQLTALAIDFNDPDILYSGVMRQSIYKSQDGGVSWYPSSAGMNPNEAVRAIEVDRNRPNVVYAGTESNGVFYSEDYGVNWIILNDGLSNRAVLDLVLSSDGTTLYATTQGGGVFRLSTLSQSELDALGADFDIPEPTEYSSSQSGSESTSEGEGQPGAASGPEFRLPEWNESYLLEEDPVGDINVDGMDLTAGFAAKDDEFLYFEIQLADPTAEIAQFDIILEIDGVELMISHTPGSPEGYANDFNNIGLEGPTENTYFNFGETYQGQISLDFLGNPESINLRQINAMVGDGNTSWGASDDWFTNKDTPSLAPAGPDSEILTEIILPDWDDNYLIDTDPVGDLEREGLDFTKIYAAQDDSYLYFEVEFVDPSADVVQFDILLTIDGVETMINHTATDTKGYINDPDLGGEDGSLSGALFLFGDTYRVQIPLESLGNPDQLRLRSVGAAVGSGGDDWGVTDSWYTEKNTPYYEWPAEDVNTGEEALQETFAEDKLEPGDKALATYLPYLIAGGGLLLLGGGWYVLKNRTKS